MTTDNKDFAFTYKGIGLHKTCGACPEQYDAYRGDRIVGYLRLRHGCFTVDFPTVGGREIFCGHPKGDGIFDEDEREHYLTVACKLIRMELKKEQLNA